MSPSDSPAAAATPSYVVTCWSCKTPFEALDTAWCACLVSEPSLVCNNCLKCFCQAPHPWKKGFWAAAPEALWDRKVDQLRRGFVPRPNPEPSEVVRPLVLVVERHRHVQRMTARVLAELGFGMILAGDAEAALELVRTYRPQVVLTEAFLPKLDGREMCRRIKDDPASAGTKTVVMTALYTATAHRHEAIRDFRVDDYLSKPVSFEKLSAVLSKLATG